MNSNFLGVPQRSVVRIREEDRPTKPQMEFITMNQYNNDPLCRQGKPPDPMTLEDLAQHKTEGDMWMAVDGKVYDISLYAEYHPGGRIIKKAAGKDGSNLFKKYHPWVNIEAILGKYQVGYLV